MTQLNLVKVLYDYLKSHPAHTVGIVALSLVLTPLSSILVPHIYGKIINAIQTGSTALKGMLFLLVGLMALMEIGSIINDVIEMYSEPKLYDYIKTHMVKAVLDKYDGNLLEPKTGQVVSKIVRAPVILSWWVFSFLSYLLPQIFTILFAFAYFAYYDWLLAMALVLMLVGTLVLTVLAPTRCMEASVKREQELDNVHEGVEDLLRNLISVYSNDTAEQELQRLHISGGAFLQANTRALSCLIKFKAIGGVPLIIVFFSIIVFRCVHLVKTGKLTAGTFVSIFGISSTLISTLSWVVSLVKEVAIAGGALLDAQHSLSSRDAPGEGDLLDRPLGNGVPFEEGIGFYGVSYSYTGKSRTFDNVTIHFPKYERTVVLGEIGRGKSTALKMLMAFIRPQEGDLYLDGQWYSAMPARDVRSRVAYMPQECTLFDRSLLENILYGSRGKTEQDVMSLMRDVGFDLRDAFSDRGVAGDHQTTAPSGILRSQVGKNGSGLSGGQRQLVWLLRILLRKPDYILLDEPTASMDQSTKGILIRILSKLPTLIIVTHDEDLLVLATRMVEWPAAY